MPRSIAANKASCRARLGLAIPGIVFCVFLGACQEDKPAAEAPVRPVRTQIVEITDAKNPGSAVGEIKPRYEANIGFRLPGKLAARLVDVGQMVQKGEIIARLDSTNEQTAVSIAEADIKAAQAELTDAAGQEQRQRDLLQRGFTAQVNYDAAARRWKLAQAKVESAQLSRSDAIERLSYTDLRSADAGVVTAVGAEAGQVVATGQMVIRVARLDEKEAEFKVAERVLRSTPPDVAVIVSLLGDPNIKAMGRVREIGTTADPITRTFPVRISLTDPPEAMRFGATVQGRIVQEDKKIVQLPSSALFQSDNSPAVWVFDSASSTVLLRPVKILRYEVDHILVTEGLSNGERVVTAGVQKLFPGMKVRLL
jgi:RND family efflux transporter MFP subunit